jgi:hypothetical protein
MLYLDGEANVPAWFQSMLLLCCAFLLAAVCKTRDEYPVCARWRVMSVVFVLLSLDEAACIHEGVGNQLSSVLHASGVFFYAWVIPGSVFVLLFFLWSIPFLRRLPETTRMGFLVAGCIYVSGAIGFEMFGAWYDSNFGARNLTLMTLNTLEESFECAGILIFTRAILLHLQHNLCNAHGDLVGHSFAATDSHHVFELDVID